jgi:hypothetical protein
MKGNNLTQKEYYELLRKQIEHEDRNIDSKTNWLLVLQGFLLVGYISLLTDDKITLSNKTALITILCLTGLILSFFALLGILASFVHMTPLVKLWEKPDNDQKGEIKMIRKQFPPIVGKGRWVIINGGIGHTRRQRLFIRT